MRSFINISGTVFNLQSRHNYLVEMAMFNVHRAIIPNIGKPWFMGHVFCTSLHSALHLCGFVKISCTAFNLQSGHEYMVEMAMLNVQMAINTKSRQTRVTVHEFCTSSDSPLNLCEV